MQVDNDQELSALAAEMSRRLAELTRDIRETADDPGPVLPDPRAGEDHPGFLISSTCAGDILGVTTFPVARTTVWGYCDPGHWG